MSKDHHRTPQEGDLGRDGRLECQVLQGEDFTEFAAMGYSLSSDQVSTLGAFMQESQPSLRALRSNPAIRPFRNPFEDVSRFQLSTSHPDERPSFSGHGEKVGSASDRVIDALQRLRGVDAKLSSTISFLDRRAHELAEDSDRRFAAGEERTLEGIPFTVKDVIDVVGALTTGGSRARVSEAPARQSASVIALLEEAGAIPIAKDSTTEFAAGGMDTPLKGVCRNPWNPARWSGGSSSGTAVAVASGAVPFGVGTDVSGSVRMPAAFCGVTGLKPTLGRVPGAGVIPMSWSTEVVGPLARDARTIAAVFSVMAGGNPDEPPGHGRVEVETSQVADLSGCRIAIPRDELFTDCDSSVLEGLDEVREALSSKGVASFETEIPNAALAHDAGFQVIYPETLTIHDPQFADWEKYDDFTIERLARGMGVLASDYLRAKQLGVQLQEDLLSVLNHAEAILVPTVPATAPTISDSTMSINGRNVPSYAYQSRITMICSLTGFPALTLPVGLDSSGCPVGATLITRPYREDIALHLAVAFQSSTGHHLRKPAKHE